MCRFFTLLKDYKHFTPLLRHMSTLWILPMPPANSISGRPTRLLVSTSISRESSCTRDHSSFDLNFSDLFPKCRAREKVQRKEKLQWLRRWRRLHLSIQKSSFRQKCGRWGMSKYIISIWNVHKDGVTQFIEQANNHHPTIKFTAEISETEITFLPFIAQYRPTMPNLKQILMQKWHLIQQQPRLNS